MTTTAASANVLQAVRLKVSPLGLISAAGTLVAGASLLGFLGPLWWFFDLFSHFRVQYTATLFLLALPLLVTGRWTTGGILAAFVVANLSTILPLYMDRTDHLVTTAPAHRAMLINVQTSNERYDAVAQAIEDHDPDLLLLLEVNHDWLQALPALKESHPHQLAAPRDDEFGIALFSKFPLERAEIVTIGSLDVPSVRAEITLDDQRLMIFGTHPLPPVGAAAAGYRDEHLAALSSSLQKIPLPVLLLGDLNVTPWSIHYQRVLEHSGLRDCSQGRGVQATWPTFFPVFLIPIDHCLHSPQVVVQDHQVGPWVGSDHYPVIVDFAILPLLQDLPYLAAKH